MTDVNLGFKKFHRAYLEFNDTGLPIAFPEHPSTIELVPGFEMEEIPTTARTGEEVTALSYPKGIKAQINLSFPTSAPDLETLIFNRKPAAVASKEGFVLLEAVAVSTTVAAKPATDYGGDIAAQSASNTKAKAWYLDKDTKLQVSLAIVDSAPTGDQIKIGAGGQLTLSSALVAKKVNLYVWCPCTMPDSVQLSTTAAGLIKAALIGIGYDGTIKMAIANNCAPLLNGSFTSDPKRDIGFRILPDSNDGTGLGYNVITIADRVIS